MSPMVKFSRGALLACAALTVLLAGCGVSQYNALANRRVGALRGEVRFRGLYAPSQVPGTPFSIRVPIVFSGSYQENSSHKDDGAVISPDRLQPPFLKLPGFKLCFEGTNTSGTTRLPFYCYVAARPAQPGDADKLAGQLQAQLKKTFPDTPDEWQVVDAESPTGVAVHWRKIRVEGEQPFMVKEADQVKSQSLPGVFELWIHDADNYVAMIAWRTPKSIEGAPAAAPTGDAPASDANPLVNLLEGPPKDAKLDMTELPAATAGTLTIDTADGG